MALEGIWEYTQGAYEYPPPPPPFISTEGIPCIPYKGMG